MTSSADAPGSATIDEPSLGFKYIAEKDDDSHSK